MTAINLKNIIEIAQRKIAVVDSNSSTRDLENLMEITMLTGGGHKADSGGFDSDVSNYVGRVVFIDSGSEGFFKFNQTIAGAPSATPNQNFTQIIKSGTYTTNPSAGSSYTGRQGSNYGYTFGGRNPGAPTSQFTIDKFSLSSDANATDVGDVAVRTLGAGGHSSATDGYATAGQSSPAVYNDMIQKYPFASDGNATDIGYDMATARRFIPGTHSETHGYVAGGSIPSLHPAGDDTIEKFAFTNDANGTDVGDLTVARMYRAGQNSTTDGYASGGVNNPGSGIVNVIDKYSFTSDGNASDVGDITPAPVGRYAGSGTSSTTHGYTAGGMSPGYVNIIDKFPFAADGNATDVGDLIATKRFGAGQYSTTHAYMSGGGSPYVDTIQKWSTSSDENASDIADLTVARDLGAPAQY